MFVLFVKKSGKSKNVKINKIQKLLILVIKSDLIYTHSTGFNLFIRTFCKLPVSRNCSLSSRAKFQVVSQSRSGLKFVMSKVGPNDNFPTFAAGDFQVAKTTDSYTVETSNFTLGGGDDTFFVTYWKPQQVDKPKGLVFIW